MIRETRWQRASERIAPLLGSGGLQEAWQVAAGALKEPRGRDEAEFQLVLSLAILAAQYGEEKLALAWVDQHESSRRGPEWAGIHEAIRIAVHLATKNYPAAQRRARLLDWRKLPATAWIQNVRLLLATQSQDDSRVLDLLKRPAGDTYRPQILEPYDRANRLRILGAHFFGKGQWERGIAYFRAALRHFALDRGIGARLKEVEILGAYGTAAYHGGRLDEAERTLNQAIEAAEALHHAFYRDKFRHVLALVWADREDFRRAEALLLRVADDAGRRSTKTGADHFLQASALLSAADFSADMKDAARGMQYVTEACRLLDERDHPRYRGYVHMYRGRLEALGSSKESAAKAFEHFETAERYFGSLGTGDLIGLAKVSLYRGRLHMKLREVREALSQALECAEAARASRFLPLQTSSLLLKSQILLEQEAPEHHRLYEDILGNLGIVHTPVVLFKVIANLYLYSWELGPQIDLTDFHLRQINKMAEILDQETFGRLYKTHVVCRVVQRAVARTLGVSPSQLEPET